MTLEGPGHGDDAPAPPASTRWSDESGEDDDGLLPPYVPGGHETRPSSPDEAAGRQGAPPEPTPPEPAEPVQPPEEPEPADEPGTDFSWDAPGSGEVMAALEAEAPVEEAGGEPQAGDGGVAAPEAGTEPPLDAGFAEPHASGPADRLERLAEILRREGVAGIQRELGAGDRLTSLLAGVLAGYLAGMED